MSGMRRVLAHRVVHAGRVYRLAIADISGPEIVVEPFSVETAGTPFVDGTVFILSASSMTHAPEWAGMRQKRCLQQCRKYLIVFRIRFPALNCSDS